MPPGLFAGRSSVGLIRLYPPAKKGIGMASPKDEYKKLKLIESLKEELLKAYRKNSALRSRKIELEDELSRLNEKLKANGSVDEVLARPEFRALEIAASKEFLRDIELEADAQQRKRKPSTSGVAKRTSGPRSRTNESDKRAMLAEVVRLHNGEDFMVRDISKYLLDKGISTPATVWLKSLNIPAAAIPDMQPGNRRAGKRFIPSKVEWLAQEPANA
jgi:hypothetical protein